MRSAFLSLLILCATLAQAQKNYVPAILIGPQNDSLHGFIDYRNWRITPDEISFKSLSGEERKCRPKDMQGFLIIPENELYVSRPVKLDITSHNLDHVLGTNKREYLEDTVFMLSIVQASYNLYLYTDKNDRAHFVYDSAGQPTQELLVTKKNVNNTSVQTLNTYQQQLANLFIACEAVSKKAFRAQYAENDLRSLFVAYHECQHPSDKVVVKKKEKSGITWGVLAGASFNSYTFTGPHYLASGKYGPSQSPLLGLFLTVPLGRDRRQFAMGAEALYRTSDASGTMPDYSIMSDAPSDVNLKFTYVQLNVLFRYTYPKGTVRPFANVGVGNGLIIKENKNELLRQGLDPEVAIDGPRKHEESLFGGIGAQFKRFQVEGRYVVSNGFSPYNIMSVGVHSLQLMLRVNL